MDIKRLFKEYKLNTGTVAAWGQTVYIKELSASSMEEMRGCKSELEMAAVAIIMGVTDEDGKTVFSKADKKKLLDMSAADLVLVSSNIIELSDLGADPEGKT